MLAFYIALMLSFNFNANAEQNEEADEYGSSYAEYEEYEEYENNGWYEVYEGFGGFEEYYGKEYEKYREYFPEQKSKEYIPIKKTDNNEEIVIFFSFASEESYDLLIKSYLIKHLKSLNYKIVLYHVDFYSPFDEYLSKLWLNMDMTNMQDVLFDRVFRVMRYGKKPNSESDVRRAFSLAGAADDIYFEYFYPSNFSVYTRELKRKRMIADLEVTKVPSIYVNGKYLINDELVSNANNYPLVDYVFLIEHIKKEK